MGFVTPEEAKQLKVKVFKDEVDKDLDKIMSRFDRVESKLDNLMERIIK